MSLDPDNTRPRYFRQARSAAEKNDENPQTKKWLDMASGIDDAARILIRYCLAVAAQDAVDQSREWVALSKEITKEYDLDIKILDSVTDDADAFDAENPNDREKEKIEGMLKKLEEFTHLADTLSSHLRSQLDRIITPLW